MGLTEGLKGLDVWTAQEVTGVGNIYEKLGLENKPVLQKFF